METVSRTERYWRVRGKEGEPFASPNMPSCTSLVAHILHTSTFITAAIAHDPPRSSPNAHNQVILKTLFLSSPTLTSPISIDLSQAPDQLAKLKKEPGESGAECAGRV